MTLKAACFAQRYYVHTASSSDRPWVGRVQKGSQTHCGKIDLQIPEYLKPKQRSARQCHLMKFNPVSNTYYFCFYVKKNYTRLKLTQGQSHQMLFQQKFSYFYHLFPISFLFNSGDGLISSQILNIDVSLTSYCVEQKLAMSDSLYPKLK